MTGPTQAEYWNSESGERWAEYADPLDSMLAPFMAPASAIWIVKALAK